MGSIRHHAIIITGFDIEYIHSHIMDIAQKYDYFLTKVVSPIIKSLRNYYESIFIGPDGVNEEWDLSVDGDRFREEVLEVLNHDALDVIHLEYGGNWKDPVILNQKKEEK